MTPQVVCLLDVLGFEHLLNRIGLSGIHSKYRVLIDHVTKQRGGVDIVPLPDGSVAMGHREVGNAYFSDSLVFWTPYAGSIGLFSFMQMISEMICLGLEIGLPLRGAIAVGEAILDAKDGVFLGQPLVEVARTERLQEWIGASFGPSINDESYKCNFYLNTVLPFKSHYKDTASRLATGIAVDWPRHWRDSRESEPDAILRALDVDRSFSVYYETSLRFIEFSRKNHDWFKSQAHLDYG
jgi:hypothetical protein